MKALIIEKTDDTPTIILDPENKTFKIADRSLPEDANGFYSPVFIWLTEFLNNPTTDISFEFNLEYFNTSSAKQIAKVLLILEKISTKVNVEILWKHKAEDLDMKAAGERYSKLLNVKFSFISL
ncbi:MAG: DUF1987 domain-containing protein [Endomicrobiia bacterium]